MKTFRAVIEASLLWLALFIAATIPALQFAPDSFGFAIGVVTSYAGIAYFYWRTK